MDRWDKYFYDLCHTISLKSPCISRKIGAILVKDNSIISTGYNGPPRGVEHCQGKICPRRTMGFASGEGLEFCPAVHAEMNAVIDAARKGTSTLGTILYMNCVIPCKSCMGILMNAGVKELVVTDITNYDRLATEFRHSPSFPSIRTFHNSIYIGEDNE